MLGSLGQPGRPGCGARGAGDGGAGTGDQEAGTGDQEAGRNMLRNLGVHAKTQVLSLAFQDLLEFRRASIL